MQNPPQAGHAFYGPVVEEQLPLPGWMDAIIQAGPEQGSIQPVIEDSDLSIDRLNLLWVDIAENQSPRIARPY